MKRFGTHAWCWIPALIVALLGICPCLAQAQDASLNGTGSASSGSSISKTFSLHIPVAERQSISVGTEIMKAASVPQELADEVRAKPAWGITAVPITVGYSYELADAGKGIVPVVGVGLSYYFSQIKKHPTMDTSGSRWYVAAPGTPDAVQKELGMGYGAQVTLGLRTDLPHNLFVQTQGRARYVNGLAIMGQHADDMGAEFTKLDFTIGFGYKF